MSMPGEFTLKVVGVSFVPGYPTNIFALNDVAEQTFTGRDGESISVVLKRNPANEFDSNAIEVHVPTLGDDGMIGHVPAAVASRLAPSIDAGDEWTSEIYNVAIHPDHPENPGIHLKITRAEEAF